MILAWAARWWRFARTPGRGLGASDHAAFQRAVARAKAAHKTPGPGATVPLAHAAAPPARQPPGPGHQVSFTITTWRCGQMRAWDGAGHLIAVRECACARGEDWGRWEQELTQ